MRALEVAPGARLRWRSAPAPPAPGPLGAIVHPIAVATCDMDRPIGLGRTPFPLPLHFCHECVAEVLSVGSDVESVRPGERVVVPFQINCGTCAPCREGRTGNCTGVPPISMYGFGVAGGHWGGALSDELAVPFADAMLVPLPAGVDAVGAASVADNVSDGFRHVAPHLPGILERDPEAEVLILAATTRRPVFTASVPIYAGLVARALGARRVKLVDSRAAVRAQAAALGLEPVEPRRAASLAPAPLTVDVSAHPRGLRLALTKTAPDGVCSSAGMLHSTARIPASLMFGRNATLHLGRTHARAVIPQVLELIASGRLDPGAVTTLTAGFDDAPAALGEHLRGASTKTVLTA
jgi:alcohol dehydrogenase